MSVWAFMDSIQSTLDEAAGINTRTEEPNQPTLPVSAEGPPKETVTSELASSSDSDWNASGNSDSAPSRGPTPQEVEAPCQSVGVPPAVEPADASQPEEAIGEAGRGHCDTSPDSPEAPPAGPDIERPCRQCAALESLLHTKTRQLDTLRAEGHNAARVMGALRADLLTLTRERDALAARCSGLEADNKVTSDTLRALKADAAHTTSSAQSRASQLQTAWEEERALLLAEVEQARSDGRQRITTLERRVASLERDLSNAMDRATDAENRAVGAQQVAGSEIRDLSVEVRRYCDELERAHATAAARSRQVALLESALEVAQGDAQRAQASLKANQSSQSEYEQEIDRLRKRVESMDRDAASTESAARRTEAALQARVRELEASVSAMDSEAKRAPLPDVSSGKGRQPGPPPQREMSPTSIGASLVQAKDAPVAPPRATERELARVSMELAVLRQEHEGLKGRNDALVREHDQLLQLLGEKIEELEARPPP